MLEDMLERTYQNVPLAPLKSAKILIAGTKVVVKTENPLAYMRIHSWHSHPQDLTLVF